MDLKDKRSSMGEEMDDSGRRSPASSQAIKSCSDCKTTRTPLWRGGPAGPKSLCNACGIKYNKKRRALLGLDRGGGGRTEKGGSKNISKKNVIVKRWMQERIGEAATTTDVVLQQRLAKLWRNNTNLCEEEKAAILLMALSCGSSSLFP